MMNSLVGIIQTAENDLSVLENSRITLTNKPAVAQIIKKSAADEMIKVINGIIDRHKDSSQLYDILKSNLFNITIQKKIVGDCEISLTKNRTSSKEKRDTILKLLKSINATYDRERKKPNNVYSTERIAKTLKIDNKYAGTILNKMKNEGILGNIPYSGWFIDDIQL